MEAFVLAQAESTPFHLPGWSRAVERGCGQRGRMLVGEVGGSIVGLLPLTDVRSRLFGRALVSAGFAVGGGVLGEGGESLASAAWELAQRCGARSVELRGGTLPQGWAVDAGSYLGFTRPLAEDDDAELKAIPRKQRAEVRRSLEFDLDISVGRDRSAQRAHYQVYAESVRNLGTPVFPASLFSAILGEVDSDILTVTHAGKAVASVLSLYHGSTVYPYWGGGTAAARGLRAHDRMYFALMAHARERGCTSFDFGRSKVGSGPAAFKKNWGFEGVPLRYAGRSAGAARQINPTDARYSLMVRTWKRLPLWLANAAGPFIARGLG